jgi:hypothetical protein
MNWLLSKLLAAPAGAPIERCPINIDDWVQRGGEVGWVMRFEPEGAGQTDCYLIVEPEEGGEPRRWHIQDVTWIGSRRY